MTLQRLTAWALLLIGAGCTNATEAPSTKSQLVADMKRATDHHSYSRPEEAVTTHLIWSAEVDFETRQVRAMANHDIVTSYDAQR